MNNDELSKYELTEPCAFPASVLIQSAVRSQELVAAVKGNRALPDTEGIDEKDIFTWSAVISNQRVDSYFTRMAESSLKNYEADCKTGVVFLDSHNMHNRVGYSIDGRFEAEGTPKEAFPRVMADFYTVRGVKLGEVDTDTFIKGVQFGLIRDVSIGFKAGEGFRFTCSICRESIWSWDCEHLLGKEYELATDTDDDPTDGESRKVICTAWVENARLSEVSGVYDGATPEAMIVKATRELRAGRLSPDDKRFLEQAYRIHLPETPKQFRGANLNNEGADKMADKDENKTSGATDKLVISLRTVAALGLIAGLATDEADGEKIVASLRSEVERLKPFEAQAAEGKKLRAALIEETLGEGVRAFGADKFDREAKAKMLEALDVEAVIEMRSAWSELADAKHGKGGRRSQDNPKEGKEGEEAETEGKEGDETEIAAESEPFIEDSYQAV